MSEELMIPNLRSTSKEGVLNEIAELIASRGVDVSARDLFERLWEREQKASTGAEQGLAIPHATVPGVHSLIVAFARSSAGIDFGALDNGKSYFFFVIIVPSRALKPGEMSYLQIISSICKHMRSTSLRKNLRDARTVEDLLNAFISDNLAKGKGAMAI